MTDRCQSYCPTHGERCRYDAHPPYANHGHRIASPPRSLTKFCGWWDEEAMPEQEAVLLRLGR